MDFQQLYQLLSPELTSRRAKIVEKTWRRLDGQGHGMLPLQYLFQHYNVDNHPDVASGLRQGQDVLSRFLDAFDAAEKGETGLITQAEFLSNYKLISGSYPHDENAFVKMMECVWGLKENESGVIISIEALILQLRDKLLLRMKGAETEEQVLIRGFKYIDLNDTGVLDRKEFKHAIQVLGVATSDEEINALFNEFDQEGRGFIDYSTFVYTITGKNDHITKKSVTHSLFATATKRIID